MMFLVCIPWLIIGGKKKKKKSMSICDKKKIKKKERGKIDYINVTISHWRTLIEQGFSFVDLFEFMNRKRQYTKTK